MSLQGSSHDILEEQANRVTDASNGHQGKVDQARKTGQGKSEVRGGPHHDPEVTGVGTNFDSNLGGQSSHRTTPNGKVPPTLQTRS